MAGALVHHGWRVALVGRRAGSLDEVQSAIGPDRSRGFVCDVTEPMAVVGLRDEVERWAGAPSVLVNAHGLFGPIDPMLDVDPTEWLDAFRTNFEGTYLTCRAFVPAMIEARFGRVLNATSAASLGPPRAAGTAYATSKVAVNELTRHLAVSLRGTGVTANVFHPGEVQSDMWAHIRESSRSGGRRTAKFAAWADRVAASGGDAPEKSGRLVMDVVDGDGSVNGAFLWIDDPMQPPRPSWPPDEA